MNRFISSSVGVLRVLGFLEGMSLVALVLVAVPVKYLLNNPALVKAIGPVHGVLFLLFVFKALQVGVEKQWRFRETTWKVLLACLIPFGTFVIDYWILRKLHNAERTPAN
jgi:integral membrane protein